MISIKYPITPRAKKESIVQGKKYRFTILTSRLIRIEYNENGIFEDRATQSVINRDFEAVNFTVSEENSILKITTDDVQLTYCTNKPFTQNTLSAKYVGKNAGVLAGALGTEWFFGVKNKDNLKGTARTLDEVNGACQLEDGIMSMGGITVLDDSKSIIIKEDGWIEPREEESIDQYLFCYGESGAQRFDYKQCLSDFYKLTGKTPLIPRFALGNWWSRYHAYTQQEYTELMERFKKEDVPFSVAVIDMDWHYVKIESKYGRGWTGYTWNENLFPDHVAFLNFLHNEGLKTSLNLHPQEGINAHEKAYTKMAEAMGIDAKSEKCVDFNITDRKFLDNYFEILHHPLEKEGVDFWWIDWQQGNTTHIPGLDPLWMLNHFHTIDNAKDGKRPLIFSRYSGPGSQRYPLGFSGDTVISWDSLDFQPYFTANASNIGYTWWSHDIGGHMYGERDEELITRWYQYGVFSPINRLHSTCCRFLGKEPWKFNKACEISMKKFLKLRHELIPYLYTMNYHTYKYDEPIVRPLYFDYHNSECYMHKNEYCFGTQMLVSPITKPHDSVTTLGCSSTYLPEGLWYDFFTNHKYNGNRTLNTYRTIYDMPVFVKAGGIVPMAKLMHVNDIENPTNMKIKVFCGNDNVFTLYEDDGETTDFENGCFATTKMELVWNEKPQFVIDAPEGDLSVIPQKRNYEVEFIGIENACIKVFENDAEKSFTSNYENGILSINVADVTEKIEFIFTNGAELQENNTEKWLCDFLEHTYSDNFQKDDIFVALTDANTTLEQKLSWLTYLDINEDMRKALIEIITAY